MTSQEAKIHLLNYFLWKHSYKGAFTESLQYSDILAVNRNFFTTEVEVKTQREDLLNEMHTISLVLSPDPFAWKKLRQRRVKYDKHRDYLKGPVKSLYSDPPFIPNNFYIAIPPELHDHRLHALPPQYGIMIIHPNGKIEVQKQAIKLHKERITEEYAWKLVQKVSYENLNLRDKLWKGGVKDEPSIENS